MLQVTNVIDEKNEEKTKRRTDDNVYRVKRTSVGRLHERYERHYVGRLNTGNRGWVTLVVPVGWQGRSVGGTKIPTGNEAISQRKRAVARKALQCNVSLPLPSAPRSEISPRGVLFAWKIKPARPPGTSPLSSPFSPRPLWSSFAPVIVFATKGGRVDPRKGQKGRIPSPRN